jgi:hypothetical protein
MASVDSVVKDHDWLRVGLALGFGVLVYVSALAE